MLGRLNVLAMAAVLFIPGVPAQLPEDVPDEPDVNVEGPPDTPPPEADDVPDDPLDLLDEGEPEPEGDGDPEGDEEEDEEQEEQDDGPADEGAPTDDPLGDPPEDDPAGAADDATRTVRDAAKRPTGDAGPTDEDADAFTQAAPADGDPPSNAPLPGTAWTLVALFVVAFGGSGTIGYAMWARRR